MKKKIEFPNVNRVFRVRFSETVKVTVNKGEIPKDYGKITYTQNKTIIVS